MKKLLTCILLITTNLIIAQEIKTLNPGIELLDFSKEGEQSYLIEEDNFERAYDLMENGKKLEELPKVYRDAYNNFDEMSTYWGIGSEGCSWYCGGGPREVTASTYLSSQGKASYSPQNAHDLNYKNAWVEGVEGYGIGEYLLYFFDAHSPRITEIVVVNGYVKSEKAWRENSRVKKLKMYIDEEPYAILNLKDQRAANHFKVDPIGIADRENLEPYYDKTSTMKFEILEVYRGDKYEDTVISEIYFDGIDVHCFVAGTMITMADNTQKPIEQLQVGDNILSCNMDTKTYYHTTIKALDNPIHRNLIKISLDNGTNITSTKDHPFISPDGELLSYNPLKTQKDYDYDTIGYLRIGSVLQTNSGSNMVIDILSVNGLQQTYTIVSLDEGNTFFANNILVGTEPLRKQKICDKHKISK